MITIAPPTIARGGSVSPRRTQASVTVITGVHCVMSADSHDSTCRCDQITNVCQTNPGTSATPAIANQSRALGHDGMPASRNAVGVITSAAASITQAK